MALRFNKYPADIALVNIDSACGLIDEKIEGIHIFSLRIDYLSLES